MLTVRMLFVSTSEKINKTSCSICFAQNGWTWIIIVNVDVNQSAFKRILAILKRCLTMSKISSTIKKWKMLWSRQRHFSRRHLETFGTLAKRGIYSVTLKFSSCQQFHILLLPMLPYQNIQQHRVTGIELISVKIGQSWLKKCTSLPVHAF